MGRGNRWYRRRQPLVTDLPRPAPPAPLVPAPRTFGPPQPARPAQRVSTRLVRAAVVNTAGGVPRPRIVRTDLPRPGLFRRTLPPWKAPPPPRILPPTLVRSDFRRAGQVTVSRPPKKPVVNIAGRLPLSRVVRPDVPGRVRPGQFRHAGLPAVANVPSAQTERRFWLRAAPTVVFDLRAWAATLFNLRASEAMSIPSNLSFFQGEDIQLNFALTPPTDITGWTLTGTVQNKLGGSTQFTFTPGIQDAGRGWFQASFPRAQTSALSPGDYVWDIRRTDSGKNAVLAHGEITLKQPVTP